MIFERPPKISCVTVTTGRDDLIGGALRCFEAQTYANKELVVVSQGTAERNATIRQMVSAIKGAIFIEAPSNISLGAMRNVSIELTTGDIICQWDDDDFYHPDRLMTQFKHLRGRAVASLYTQHLKYFKNTGRMYWIDYTRGPESYMDILQQSPYKRFLTGSVMFRKSCFHQFRSFLYPEFGYQSDREEDLNVLQKLMQSGSVVGVNEGHHYVYVFHGGNTYEHHHHRMCLHLKHLLQADELRERKPVLDRAFAAMGLSGFDLCTAPDFMNIHDPNSELGEEVVFTYPA